MAYLFTPSQITDSHQLERSLYVTYPNSVTVWLDDTGWHEGQVPDPEALAIATFVFTRPVVVSDDTAASLMATSLGGTIQKIEPDKLQLGYGTGIYGQGIYGGSS